ncbi:MAG: topoisomerase DNA-binding C4 zinc finger domain-containing protein [Rhodothermales bacterium]
MRTFIALIFVVVYFAGCGYVNELVREACTHGNCTHGWYSKENEPEKLLARVWMFGFPVAAFFLYNFLFDESRKARKSSGVQQHSPTSDSKSPNARLSNSYNTTSKKGITHSHGVSYRSPLEPNPSKPEVEASQAVVCPDCGSLMKLRVARRGYYAGKKFWGCSRYPACGGIVNTST